MPKNSNPRKPTRKKSVSIPSSQQNILPKPKEVESLLEVMKDGHEYESIVPYLPKGGNPLNDIKKAIATIEQIRNRPLICYIANVVQPRLSGTGIDFTDDLPFNEMLSKIPNTVTAIDVLVVTPGGLGQQVSQFVNALRKKFTSVEFILPYMCMSAGTLWVLSGDKIWMDERAFIGPIDPQVRSKSGEFVPAQSIHIFLDEIRKEGEKALSKNEPIPWPLIRLLDVMDARQLGDAISSSQYSIKLASGFLEKFKFKHWINRKNGAPVTERERIARAQEVATKLCDNSYWKSHGHGITREIANSELKLHIEHLENELQFSKAVRRFWALLYYTLERTLTTKMFLSSNYTLSRHVRTTSNVEQ